MCYYTEQKATIAEIAKRFKAIIDNPDHFLQSDFINGFDFASTPIIIDKSPEIIHTDCSWGLIPTWAKDNDIRKSTLNCRIETVDEKASFKNSINKRCLVIATEYFEWHWNDEKGKSKDKYIIKNQDEDIFCLAGLYNDWVNPMSGEVVHTYTILTTQANKSMKYVHNHKHRMPIMLKVGDEQAWLDSSKSVHDFEFPKYDFNMIALQVAS